MQALPKSQLLWFVEQAMHLAQRAVARYSSKFSKRRYMLHQHIVLLGSGESLDDGDFRH
ncbi:transposase IS4 family protein [Natrialba taiwanensis DSM 12281]|uniref:Transposase IS4 family protein n=1 Tax=Natrialba taiwanensis DSM 12281 TaxID=1230458 RepID=L9ZQ06_9EURY|nr:transposase IS4 family protein [Natrialba taiwanensis DSM 12281]